MAAAFLACAVFAALGSALAGPDPGASLAALRQPPFALPLAGWMGVGALYYLGMGTVLYRALAHPRPDRRGTTALALAVMLLNELWNVLLFGARHMPAALVGLAAFALPLLALTLRLRRADGPSFRIAAVYLAWVVLYDLPWMYMLWRLNP